MIFSDLPHILPHHFPFSMCNFSLSLRLFLHMSLIWPLPLWKTSHPETTCFISIAPSPFNSEAPWTQTLQFLPGAFLIEWFFPFTTEGVFARIFKILLWLRGSSVTCDLWERRERIWVQLIHFNWCHTAVMKVLNNGKPHYIGNPPFVYKGCITSLRQSTIIDIILKITHSKSSGTISWMKAKKTC